MAESVGCLISGGTLRNLDPEHGLLRATTTDAEFARASPIPEASAQVPGLL